MNRILTVAVNKRTPEKVWSNVTPSVDHFRVSGVLLMHTYLNKEEQNKGWDWSQNLDDANKVLEWEHITLEDDVSEDDVVVPNIEEVVGEEPLSLNIPATDKGRIRRENRIAPEWQKDYVSGAGLGLSDEDEEVNNLVLYTTADPITFEEAVVSEKWHEVMKLEIQAIEKNETWELMELQAGAKKIRVKWVFKTKLYELGEIEKHKARLVTKEYAQKYGIDYNEVFAQVAKWDTIQMVMQWLRRKVGISTNLMLKALSFMERWWNKFLLINCVALRKKGRSIKLCTVLSKLEGHGIVALGPILQRMVLKCAPLNLLFFIQTDSKGRILIISLYADDLIFTGNDEEIIKAFKNSMIQRKYANEVTERFGMLRCNSVRSPIVPGTKLVKDKDGVKVDVTGYKESLIFNYNQTRSNVCGWTERGILYKKGRTGELVGYTVNDYAGDQAGERVVAWSSKKQPVVTLSTTEAEFVAAASYACQVVWMKRILDAFNHPQKESITLYCDNASTIKLSKNVVLHGRSKHIHVMYHFLHELSNDKVIELIHCGTKK
ncbi:copia-type polyprotein [Gossypium australe]|uniref:Copia-type polyprotein n=1 Tax=Gossypium australe TaxID=47621 RepID=A0A5B6U8W9_9ROSI|nr:copia-type polyprotein [Gossypium australe]